MKEFFYLLFNGITPIQFCVFMFYATGGLLLNLLFDICGRRPESLTSPKKFSIKYWFNDNWKRILISFILLPIIIILFSEIMGNEINIGNAFFAGFSSDAIANLLKRRSLIGGAKQ